MKIPMALVALALLSASARAECPSDSAMKAVAEAKGPLTSEQAASLPGTSNDAERRHYARIFLHLRGQLGADAPLTGLEHQLVSVAREFFAGAPFSCAFSGARPSIPLEGVPGISFSLAPRDFTDAVGEAAAPEIPARGVQGLDESRFANMRSVADRLSREGIALFPNGVEGVPDELLPRLMVGNNSRNCPDDMGDAARRACRRGRKSVRLGFTVPLGQ